MKHGKYTLQYYNGNTFINIGNCIVIETTNDYIDFSFVKYVNNNNVITIKNDGNYKIYRLNRFYKKKNETIINPSVMLAENITCINYDHNHEYDVICADIVGNISYEDIIKL